MHSTNAKLFVRCTKQNVSATTSKQTITEKKGGKEEKEKEVESKNIECPKISKRTRHILAVITPRFIPLKLLSRDIERWNDISGRKMGADWPVRVSACDDLHATWIIVTLLRELLFTTIFFYNSILERVRCKIITSQVS